MTRNSFHNASCNIIVASSPANGFLALNDFFPEVGWSEVSFVGVPKAQKLVYLLGEIETSRVNFRNWHIPMFRSTVTPPASLHSSAAVSSLEEDEQKGLQQAYQKLDALQKKTHSLPITST